MLNLVARGYTYKPFGMELFIADKTVENQICNILGKLHLTRRAELIRWARRPRHPLRPLGVSQQDLGANSDGGRRPMSAPWFHAHIAPRGPPRTIPCG